MAPEDSTTTIIETKETPIHPSYGTHQRSHSPVNPPGSIGPPPSEAPPQDGQPKDLQDLPPHPFMPFPGMAPQDGMNVSMEMPWFGIKNLDQDDHPLYSMGYPHLMPDAAMQPFNTFWGMNTMFPPSMGMQMPGPMSHFQQNNMPNMNSMSPPNIAGLSSMQNSMQNSMPSSMPHSLQTSLSGNLAAPPSLQQSLSGGSYLHDNRGDSPPEEPPPQEAPQSAQAFDEFAPALRVGAFNIPTFGESGQRLDLSLNRVHHSVLEKGQGQKRSPGSKQLTSAMSSATTAPGVSRQASMTQVHQSVHQSRDVSMEEDLSAPRFNENPWGHVQPNWTPMMPPAYGFIPQVPLPVDALNENNGQAGRAMGLPPPGLHMDLTPMEGEKRQQDLTSGHTGRLRQNYDFSMTALHMLETPRENDPSARIPLPTSVRDLIIAQRDREISPEIYEANFFTREPQNVNSKIEWDRPCYERHLPDDMINMLSNFNLLCYDRLLSTYELSVFRTVKCPLGNNCQYARAPTKCWASHNFSQGTSGARWRRRNPFVYMYKHLLCPEIQNIKDQIKHSNERGDHHELPKLKQQLQTACFSCPDGYECQYSHSLEEQMYHPFVYKTQICANQKSETGCARPFCPFLHEGEFTLPKENKQVKAIKYDSLGTWMAWKDRYQKTQNGARSVQEEFRPSSESVSSSWKENSSWPAAGQGTQQKSGGWNIGQEFVPGIPYTDQPGLQSPEEPPLDMSQPSMDEHLDNHKAIHFATSLYRNNRTPMTPLELSIFRTTRCPQKTYCDNTKQPTRCWATHASDGSLRWLRRNPWTCPYKHLLCPHVRKEGQSMNKELEGKARWASCKNGRKCGLAHSIEEQMYHPFVYKTQSCTNTQCERPFCPFLHPDEEMPTFPPVGGSKSRHASMEEGPEITPEVGQKENTHPKKTKVRKFEPKAKRRSYAQNNNRTS